MNVRGRIQWQVFLKWIYMQEMRLHLDYFRIIEFIKLMMFWTYLEMTKVLRIHLRDMINFDKDVEGSNK